MYEVRCPKCNKKLAEIGRAPISEFKYSKPCKKCAKEVKGKVFIRQDSEMVAVLDCACGYKKEKTVGHLVAVKCKKCKTVTAF